MHDDRIEDDLRRAFREESATLPFAISLDRLEQRLADRHRAGRSRRWLVAAVVAAVAVTGAAVVWSARSPLPAVGPSPVPSEAVPTAGLPEPSSLLAGHPTATLRLEAGVDGGEPGPLRWFDVGQVAFEGPFVIASICDGPLDLSVDLVDGAGLAVVQQSMPCDGAAHPQEYLSNLPLSDAAGFAVRVAADPTASWRLAIGEYPAGLAVVPTLPPLVVAEGATELIDSGAVLMSPTSGTGVSFRVPRGATGLTVRIACQGDSPVSFDVEPAVTDPILCTDTPTTHAFDLALTAGTEAHVGASAGGFVWIRLLAEAQDGGPTTYPRAPAIPANVFDTPYGAGATEVVGVGTVGGNLQAVVPIPQPRLGAATGDVVPVATYDTTLPGSRLELLSARTGDVLATLATVASPGLIVGSWADAAHDKVYYAMTPDQSGIAVEYHRVAFDGTDDTVLATSPVGGDLAQFGASSADLSRDGSMFVIDTCEAERCAFTIVDTATATVSRVERTGGPVCRIVGVGRGVVVAETHPTCSPFEPEGSIVAMPLDGGPIHEISAERSFGQVVDLPTGPVYVYQSVFSRGVIVEVIDIATGASRWQLDRTRQEPGLSPMDVRLPEGWVLLATASLGDFPQASTVERAVPILVNLVTGEQFEMVNLPH